MLQLRFSGILWLDGIFAEHSLVSSASPDYSGLGCDSHCVEQWRGPQTVRLEHYPLVHGLYWDKLADMIPIITRHQASPLNLRAGCRNRFAVCRYCATCSAGPDASQRICVWRLKSA
jgi:hypothetical protein